MADTNTTTQLETSENKKKSNCNQKINAKRQKWIVTKLITVLMTPKKVQSTITSSFTLLFFGLGSCLDESLSVEEELGGGAGLLCPLLLVPSYMLRVW